MNWKSEWKFFLILLIVFFVCYYLPVGSPRFDHAVLESLHLVKWYTQEHVILCLIPALFIAGAISVFVSQASVMKYLGPQSNKILAYGVASVSGTILAVCSCTVLPLFAGIYKMGAGLGPASAFLYSGPAINVLAIVLTARILGLEIGVARAAGAILFSILIGLLMYFFYRNEEIAKVKAAQQQPQPETTRPLWQNVIYFASMVAILVFANWARPESEQGIWYTIFLWKWYLTGLSSLILGLILATWFGLPYRQLLAIGFPVLVLSLLFPAYPLLSFGTGVIGLSAVISTRADELGDWFAASWDFAKQILPLLLIGVFFAGLFLGRPGEEGLVPSQWINQAVGGNTWFANFFASFAGALMYFATLTEIPIIQGLIGSGMGKGPALALLLAGPALSLPSILVLRSIMGLQKTLVYVCLVVVMATITGFLYGLFFL